MRQDSRSDVGLGGRWSIHHETGRHEYSLVSREASQPQLPGPYDRPSYQYPPSKDSGSSYRDQRPSSGSGPMQSQPLTSATNSDGIPSKDGLGPKIWTGTHFLPRFVRAAEVPGEGLCFFYDDGSHCKTIIDGEQVNAHWGVTKAGKPRKRLAIACVTCREKKIKCDPDFPRCVQCEKFGRVCKFKNAPRGGHNTSPSTAAAEPEDVRRMGGPASEMHRPGSNSSASVSPRTTLRQPSPEPPMSHKRMRLDFDSYPSMASEPPSLNRTPEAPRASLSWQHRQPYELPPIQDHLLNRAWQSDPYVSDPESISTLISSFFVHTDSTMALRFLPETAFKSWVTGNAYIKSPGDLMLIYSILAVGVALSGGPKNIANEYAQIAHYAQHRAACSLQLAQARLLLALYYLSLSRLNDANELISGAISASIDLQLNLELEKSIEADLTDFPYGLQRDGYSESRRRTYWACFVLERLSGMFPNRLSILNVKDIFIRLPCENELFERQAESDASFFPAAMAMSSKAVIRPLGILAYLVQLVAIWGEAMSELYRAAQSQETDYDATGFIDTVMEKLIGWRESLPERFAYSSGNMALAAQDGTLSTFLTIHLVYLHGLMKIHRHVRTESIAASVRLQYGMRIHKEATRVLDITGMLEVLLQGRRAPISAPPPFMSYVILEATDVLTAEGSLADVSLLLDRLAVARAIVDAAGMVWEEARAHQSAMEQRLDALRALRDRQPSDAPLAGSRVFDHDESKDSKLPAGRCWQMDDPMGTTFPRRMDLVYIRT
ncbi:putative transcriptional regulatory protein [Colletotrichum siamense]|uniref:Transcriptional regulatory protein n=1 Tax=Colletotrichum siamense TaxID=690259 RepID=A0A9P5EYF1_COLSI|nr:putative transcriptional regulatory protein [Colletotrichum siamense]KAF4861737.1 putative transcriptional regulatory protein [Colletotrichum siamense]